jgi:hypothetical protein
MIESSWIAETVFLILLCVREKAISCVTALGVDEYNILIHPFKP